MPYLVVVSGLPASGKTTLAKRLADELRLPLLAKDDIKELLFEVFPQKDRDWSTVQGRTSIAMMYAGAEALLTAGYSVMIESSFDPEMGRQDVTKLIKATGCSYAEIHCSLNYAERQKRWTQRSLHNRHPGHMDDPTHVLSRTATDDDTALFPDEAITIDTGLEQAEYLRRYDEIKNILTQKGVKGEL